MPFHGHVQRFDVLTPHTAEGLTACFTKLAELGATGDYVEFGVYQGHSLLHAYREAQRVGLHAMRFFGFDSFKGLPAIRDHDLEALFPLQQGMFACELAQVTENLRANGVDLSRVHLAPGFFEDTLSVDTRRRLGLSAASIVLVDCDLYESARRALSFMSDLVRDRTVVLFDDWEIYGGHPDKGEKRAYDEFLREHPDLVCEDLGSFGWHGRAFVLTNVEVAQVRSSGAA